MDEWATVAATANHAITGLAVLVGGAWAYFKFVRGRTFARRAELDVSGSLFTFGDDRIVKATVTLRNAGLSKLPLKNNGKFVRLYGSPAVSWTPNANIFWQQLMHTPIFEGHQWVEAQETVTDEVLIPVPFLEAKGEGGGWLAFRVHAQVWGERRPGHRAGPRWGATTLVPADIDPAVAHRMSDTTTFPQATRDIS
jgi:hypothetical protein